jgi:hypothetical protein
MTTLEPGVGSTRQAEHRPAGTFNCPIDAEAQAGRLLRSNDCSGSTGSGSSGSDSSGHPSKKRQFGTSIEAAVPEAAVPDIHPSLCELRTLAAESSKTRMTAWMRSLVLDMDLGQEAAVKVGPRPERRLNPAQG